MRRASAALRPRAGTAPGQAQPVPTVGRGTLSIWSRCARYRGLLGQQESARALWPFEEEDVLAGRKFARTLPLIRNDHAHGSETVRFNVLRTVEVTADLINSSSRKDLSRRDALELQGWQWRHGWQRRRGEDSWNDVQDVGASTVGTSCRRRSSSRRRGRTRNAVEAEALPFFRRSGSRGRVREGRGGETPVFRPPGVRSDHIRQKYSSYSIAIQARQSQRKTL